MSSLHPEEVTSLLLHDGKVAAVGDLGIAQSPTAANAQILDFGERPVLPAFSDPHAHFAASAIAAEALVDCRIERCRSIEDILQALRDDRHKAGRSGWLIGQAGLFLDQKIEEQRFPTKAELDRVTTDIPVALRAGGHASILNSQALEALDLAAAGPGADVNWETGVVRELEHAIPSPTLEFHEMQRVLRDAAVRLFLSKGVTSVGEIAEDIGHVQAIDQLNTGPGFPIRVALYLWIPSIMSLREACTPDPLRLASDPAWLRVEGLKMFVDGGYSACTAAVKTPFQPPFCVPGHEHGKLGLTEADIANVVSAASRANLRVALHSNGERAQDLVCSAISENDLDGSQVRVEHAGNYLTDPATVTSWRRAGITPVPNPKFLTEWGGLLPMRLGEPGATGRWPFKSLLADGWELAAGSDIYFGASEECTNPLFNAWCSVARRTYQGDEVEPEESINVMDALRMSTVFAARAENAAARRGTLDVGKQADVIVLERDPRSVSADELRNVRVDFVFVDGQVAYERSGATPAQQQALSES
jgi:predicted amidohydrolase YtcJ